MFGLWKKKNTEVLQHWYVLLEEFTSSTDGFYSKIEEEIERREIPGLETSRIIMGEGRFASSRREYLRLRRERWIVDVCSSPFGTAWFFSCRLGEIPFRLRVWELAVVLVLLAALFFLFPITFGLLWGSVAFALTVFSVIALLNALATTQTRGLDDAVMKIPVLGAVYELLVRKNTSYYRIDTRLMYEDAVKAVVEAAVRDAAAEGGVDEVQLVTVSEGGSPISLIDQMVGAAKSLA
ncbi:hypothetical protein BH23VER1_BH23VER1_07280 [soil metagenome]